MSPTSGQDPTFDNLQSEAQNLNGQAITLDILDYNFDVSFASTYTDGVVSGAEYAF